MKKTISLITFMILIFVASFNSYAAIDTTRYRSENLEATFTAENITNYDLTEYNTANDKRVNIYVFRGNGCINCHNFYEYVASKLLVSHGGKIKITSYEVKNEPLNFGLLDAAKTLLNEKSTTYATPTIFVGDKTFSGSLISEQSQKQLEAAIDNLYNSKDRYDILDELSGERVFTDNATNITLTSARSLNKDYVLKTSQVDLTNVSLENGYEYIDAYDISVYQNTTKITLNSGSYKIKIPVAAQYDKYKVGYVENGQIKENVAATYSNGNIEFTTTHLSEYVIYGMNNPAPNPGTTTDPGATPGITPSTTTDADGNKDEKAEESVETTKQANNAKNIVNVKNPKTSDTVGIYAILLAVGVVALVASIITFRKK